MPRRPVLTVTASIILLLVSLAGYCPAGTILVVPIDLGSEEIMISPQDRFEELFAGDQTWPIIENVLLCP